MDDRFDGDELFGEQEAADEPRRSTEGVRILGADEARAAIDEGRAEGRIADDAPGSPEEPERPDPDPRPTLSFPRSSEPAHPARPAGEPPRLVPLDGGLAGGSEGVRIVGAVPAGDDTGEVSVVEVPTSTEGAEAGDLPHWSEPPTGEQPAVTVGDADAPRFRSGADDWDDIDEAIVVEDDAPVGEPTGVVPTVDPEDDDAAFIAEVEARRRVRAVSSQGASPRPASASPTPADLTTRLITGVAIAVLALICFHVGRAATTVLVAVIVGFAALEFFQTVRRVGFRPSIPIGVLASVVIVPIAYARGEFAYPFVLALTVVFSLLWFMFRAGPGRPVVNVAMTIGGFAYVGGLAGFAGLLLGYSNGIGLLLGLVLCVIAYDAAGYLVGSRFGRTPLAPAISPGKTLEGLVGGIVASIVVAVLFASHIHPWGGIGHSFLLGLVVGVVAPIGDLCESMVKRDLRIKDFGSLLPGHGGVLDRFDAMLFVLPAVYYLARALKLG